MALLWLGLAAGPLAWSLNQLVGYALVKPACHANAPMTHLALSAAALLATAGGGWLSWSCLRRLQHAAGPHGAGWDDRSVMLAVVGIVLNALLALLIVTAATSQFLLSPCE
jgi:hypothetical protein